MLVILVGVALANFAEPPVMVKTKSFASRLPLAPALLNTFSLKVTSIAALLSFSLT